MYITNWEEFQKATEELYIASPELVIRRQNRKKRKPDDINIMFQTRYVHTFHRSDGDLVLKVTDDRTVKQKRKKKITC